MRTPRYLLRTTRHAPHRAAGHSRARARREQRDLKHAAGFLLCRSGDDTVPQGGEAAEMVARLYQFNELFKRSEELDPALAADVQTRFRIEKD